MSAAVGRLLSMEVSEFLSWDPGDQRRYELVDGEPRAMAPTFNNHAYLQGELARLIGNHLRARGSPCDVLVNPGVVPHLLAARNFRIPDLGVSCTGLAPGQRSMAEPGLLVEIISPRNAADTWSNVWAYTTIPSVAEIVVLEGEAVEAELLRRRTDGTWPERPQRIGAAHELGLACIGFSVRMAELYSRTGLTG